MTVYLLLNSDGVKIINSNKKIPMAHWASYRQFVTNKTMHVHKNCSRQIVDLERKTLLEYGFSG